ncbi:MAG: alpha/beta fold hydrolase [Eubacteriales bacterium]|nr:alpha/beta fold hydrolase [Eubacteriales bacterium]
MSMKEISFQSFNERDTIKAWRYTPLGDPKAVVQLVHGFGEHSRRYWHMIASLQEAGFVVYADDHLAHGKTAADNDTWGDPGDKGYVSYIEDENKLREISAADYPELPFFMFGHSWGSMIARGYAEKYGDKLDGLILCGLVSQMEGCEAMREDDSIRQLIESGHGKESGVELMMTVFGSAVERYENPNGPNDWIALDSRVVADHAGDPFNRMLPTNQLMYDLLELYKSIHRDEWSEKIPNQLPIYIIGGDQDPCGNYGEGAYHMANVLYRGGNKHVSVRLYPGYRHEIHNEPDIRDEVEQGIVDFICKALG